MTGAERRTLTVVGSGRVCRSIYGTERLEDGGFVGPFDRQEFDFVDHGVPRHQIEYFFAARTDNADVQVHGWTGLERQAVVSWRWWSTDELEACDVVFFPTNLLQLVRAADGALNSPSEP